MHKCILRILKNKLQTNLRLQSLFVTSFDTFDFPPNFDMAFTGKFELVSSENFDDYLKACGVNMAKRALAAAAKPTLEFSESGGKYTMKTLSTFKNTEINFVLGQEFDEETADGRKSKSTMIADGNKLIHTQKIGDESSTTIREFSGDQLKATFTAKGVSATRLYKKTG